MIVSSVFVDNVMDAPLFVLILASIFTAGGLWWALPWGKARRRSVGWVLVAAGLAMLSAMTPPVGSLLPRSLLTLMSIVAVGSAVAMITSSRPLYAALWFGMAVLGTAGMLLFNGAQFVAMAVIVVYIGAILVMFLFVLMLDDPKGTAGFNRQSWEPLTASVVGAVLIALTTVTWLRHAATANGWSLAKETGKAIPDVVITRTVDLGNQLFLHYGVAVQALAIVLLLGLLGAAVIIAHPLEPLLDFKSRAVPDETPTANES